MSLTLLTKLKAQYCLTLAMSLALSTFALAQDDDDDFFIFDEDEEEIFEIADPFESLNRSIFSFNDVAYRNILKPVAVAYRVVPEPARRSVANVFDNLATPVSVVNSLLQLDVPNAGTEFSRFLINSTVGLAGLFDPASAVGIARNEEDLGQTLAHYGVGHGFYVVIPFIGPSSLRDGASSLANNTLDPFMQEWDPETIESIIYRLTDAETSLSLDKDTYEGFYDGALDPYIFFRSAYTQNRQGKVDQ